MLMDAIVGRFAGRCAIVTGAGRGMGLATARRLAAEGASVIVNDYDLAVAEAAVREIVAAGGRAETNGADVSDPEQVRLMVEQAVSTFGALHLAVNNAGINSPPAMLADQDDAQWDRTIAINLSGVFHCMKWEIKAMQAGDGGAIVNVSSIFGSRGLPHYAPYTAAKHGVLGLTRAAALEYAASGIRINTFCPGMHDTPMASSGGAHSDAIAAMIPMKRLGRPEEAAAITCFLLSDDASFVNGADYAGDGGMMK